MPATSSSSGRSKDPNPPRRGERPSAGKTPSPAKSSSRPLGEELYRNLYVLGIQCFRLLRRTRRRLIRFSRKSRGYLRLKKATLGLKAARFRADFIRTFSQPFHQMRRNYTSFTTQMKEARESGDRSAQRNVLWRAGRRLGRSFFRFACQVLNYAAPVAAILLLIGIINSTWSKNYVLHVEYAGQSLGYIANETVYNDAEKEVASRIISEEYIEPEQDTPHFSIAVIEDPDDLLDASALADRIILASGNEITEAAGIYIDDVFLGAVEDGDELLDYLVRVKERYSTGAEGEEITFRKSIRVSNGLYPVSTVSTMADLIPILESNQQEQKNYTVIAGDDPLTIARKVDMSLDDLVALNPDMLTTLLPGQQIIANAAVPYLGVQINRIEEYEEEIDYGTETIEDNSLPRGYRQTVSEGQTGLQSVTARVTYEDEIEVGRTVLSTTILEEPVDEVVRVGTAAPVYSIDTSGTSSSGGSSSGYIWPVAWGGYVSCNSWGYYGHTGMDIAGRGTIFGSPVLAVADGTVVSSSYQGAYGNCIMISHGNGLVTLYAHMNERYVGVGTVVSQGDTIGTVGRTGNVTGPHLHIEFRLNGQYMDPRQYIGSR